MTCLDKLQEDYPEVFDSDTLLYIGAVPSKWTEFLDLFAMARWKPTVLELDPKNAQDLRHLEIDVVEGDVRNIEELCGQKSYDVIIWEDGPEHIPESDFDSTIPQLTRVARKFVIMEAPEGIRGHRTDVPILEQQLSGVYKDTFGNYGFETFLLPQPTKPEALRIFSIWEATSVSA